MEPGPLDYLFCQKCDKHVEEYSLGYNGIENWGPFFNVKDLKDRVMPEIKVRLKPGCITCGSDLIQKYFTVNVTV